MSTYAAAPATQMLATHCAVCSRPLVDALSVELGIGPICRDGYDAGTDPAARDEANQIVHDIAMRQTGLEVVLGIARLRALGFVALADRIAARAGGKAKLTRDDGVSAFVLSYPYAPNTLAAMKAAIDKAGGRRRWTGRWEMDAVAARAGAEALRALGWFVEVTPEVEALIAAKLAAPAAPAAPAEGTSFQIRGGDKLALRTPYNPDAVAVIKAAANGQARWDGGAKEWTLPLAAASALCDRLGSIFPSLVARLAAHPDVVAARQAADAAAKASAARVALAGAAAVEQAGAGAEGVVADVVARLAAALPAGRALFPYQAAGVAFVEAAQGRALVADEMGLGKTVQALAWLAIHPEIERTLIICPASLTLNWQREAARWLPGIETYVVRNGKDAIPAARIVVVGYETAAKRRTEFMAWAPEAVVIDECHYLKSRDAQRTKAIIGVRVKGMLTEPGIATGAKHVIALSGTPLLNRPVELFTTLNLVRPDAFPHFFKFATRYCDASQSKYGWDFSGASNLPELRERLRDVMVRREKSAVLAELPAKRRATIEVALDNRAEYDRAERDFVAYYRSVREMAEPAAREEEKGARDAVARLGGEQTESHVSAEVLMKLNALRRLAGQGKVAAAIEWVRNFALTGKQLVVFAHHKDVLDAIETALGEDGTVTCRVDGDVAVEARQAAVDAFQAGTARVFLGTVGAAGVGLTLTAASDVLFVEREWTPAIEEQAEDRCHRIGQASAVTAWYLVGDCSVDRKFEALVESKRQVVGAVLTGGAVEGGSLVGALAAEMAS